MKKLNLLSLKKDYSHLFIIAVIILQAACMPFLKFKRSSQSSPPAAVSNEQNIKIKPAKEFDMNSASDVFAKEVYGLLSAKDFAAIEKIADEAREKKERLAGGYWKIDSLYKALSDIYAEYKGQAVTDENWKNRIELLKQWKEKSPESITARVALAETYTSYGWFFRGHGYIDKVSREDYVLFHRQVDLAEKELAEARNLNNKCPRWYRAMLFIGMIKSWSPDEFDEMFEEAVKSEPDYLQYYLVKSEYITPKWQGEEGDWEKFVNSLPDKLAEVKAAEPDIIYFVVVVNKIKDPSVDGDLSIFSKDRLENGYLEMEKKYGTDNLRLNQHAFVACVTGNMPSAKKAFDDIGNNWNKEVWKTQQFFSELKDLATQKTAMAKN